MQEAAWSHRALGSAQHRPRAKSAPGALDLTMLSCREQEALLGLACRGPAQPGPAQLATQLKGGA